MRNIQKADPAVRRRALLAVAGAIAVSLVLMAAAWLFRPAVEEWVNRDPRQLVPRLQLAIVVLAVLTAGPALAAAAYLWRLGSRVVRAERFPPPGQAVARDTAVVNGDAARRLGRAIESVAAILALAAAALLVAFWRLLSILESRLAR